MKKIMGWALSFAMIAGMALWVISCGGSNNPATPGGIGGGSPAAPTATVTPTGTITPPPPTATATVTPTVTPAPKWNVLGTSGFTSDPAFYTTIGLLNTNLFISYEDGTTTDMMVSSYSTSWS